MSHSDSPKLCDPEGVSLGLGEELELEVSVALGVSLMLEVGLEL